MLNHNTFDHGSLICTCCTCIYASQRAKSSSPYVATHSGEIKAHWSKDMWSSLGECAQCACTCLRVCSTELAKMLMPFWADFPAQDSFGNGFCRQPSAEICPARRRQHKATNTSQQHHVCMTRCNSAKRVASSLRFGIVGWLPVARTCRGSSK